MAGLDGPVYVERVALFDAKNRVKAEKAIKKAIRLQVEGKGFSFVEVLAECPTHLKLTPARDGEVGEGEDAAALPARREEGRRRARRAWPLPPPPSFVPGKLMDVIGGGGAGERALLQGLPGDRLGPRHRHQAGRRRRRRRADGGAAAHAGGDQRGLRLDAHPELRPGVARRHLLRRRADRRRRGALAGGARAARAGGLQRAEPREVRAARAGGRRRRLRQLGRRATLPRCEPGVKAGRRAVHEDRRRPRAR